ncbi:MAG TPA: DUF3592 domain-containing protein [Anaerolineae bacterium]|nr:DUF3592 domain-containing protein [Anaerolineae bacterium]
MDVSISLSGPLALMVLKVPVLGGLGLLMIALVLVGWPRGTFGHLDMWQKLGWVIAIVVGTVTFVVTDMIGLACVLLLMGSIAFSKLGWDSIMLAVAMRDWPLARGQVVKSKVIRKRSNSSGDSGLVYHSKIKYVYEVMGETYEGGRIYFGRPNGFAWRERLAVAKYPVGAEVDVYYDPEAPEVAALEMSLGKPGTYIAFIMGLVGTGLMGMITVIYVTERINELVALF